VTLSPHDEALIDAAVCRLDLETKVRLVSGAGMWETQPVPQVGLRSMTVSDGPIGVRGAELAESNESAAFPSSSALAASWDESLLERVSEALAGEAVRKGVDVVLGPTINLHRSPLGGRHFECFSEDPFLTGRLATAYVRALQANGVGACPKHFVTNDAETERRSVDNQVDERTLRELYLAPFEAVVTEAHPWTVMSAYNGTNGAPMSEHPLLSETLKGEWEWDGAVVSDWGGVYSTVESARAGLDLAMPGPEEKWNEMLLEAVRTGEVPEAAIDEKVRRLLRLAARAGALDRVEPPTPKRAPAAVSDSADLAREAASSGMVLLRNDATLPLDRESLRRIAVIGPGALEPRPLGGGSAMVFPPYVSGPIPALRSRVGSEIEVTATVGAALTDVPRAARSEELVGTTVRWLDDDGELVAELTSRTAQLLRSPASVPAGAVSCELVTRFVAAESGTWRIGVVGVGAFELDVDAATVLKESCERDRLDLAAAIGAKPPNVTVPVALRAGDSVGVALRYRWPEDCILFSAGLAVQEPRGTAEEEIDRAVELARAADTAVVIVGTSQAVESEGFDRTELKLPGAQDELVSAVAAVNPRTVVVVNAGAPVEMPWRDEVAAVLVTWFPGMEFGNALADVLLGDAEPGGRLPTTWPTALAAAPVSATTPTDGMLDYAEGLHIGYRAYLQQGTTPAYWFGHGLGYTQWRYDALQADTTTARVRITNIGQRRGMEVVQVYTSRPESSIDRPRLVLSGFQVVQADAGETLEVQIPLEPRTLRHWDTSSRGWSVEPGRLDVHAGPSAGSLPLSATTYLDRGVSRSRQLDEQ
jgi:beta-glucosidase